MTERASRSRLLAKSPAGFSSLASEVQSNWLRWQRWRRRPRYHLFVSSECGGDGGKRSIPATPLLQWKFDEKGPQGGEPQPDLGSETHSRPRKPVCGPQQAASARRLAAGICHLGFPKVVGGGETSLDLEVWKSELEASATERTTKWDLGYPKVSKDSFDLYDNLNLLEDQKTNKFSNVSALRSELELAWSKISELETERQSAKNKLEHFIRKIEEKAAWRRREHEKIRSVIDAVKEDLNKERKNAQVLEIMNSKLVNELTEVKLSAKQFLHEYEKERKAREMMEEVCNELAKELGDDKAEVEALKMESVKTREEVEEERKMLRMAEVWREERVQMKFIDAKLALEEKYSKLSKLQEEIEAFLSLRSDNKYDASVTAKAKALKEAVGSVIAYDVKEFSYQPPAASDGIFSIFEELQPREQGYAKEIEQCHGSVIAHDVKEFSYQPPAASDGIISIFEELQPREQGYAKEIEQCHGSVTPEANGFSENAMKRYDNMMFNGYCDTEDDSGWETVSHAEEQDSCKSPDGSEPSVTGVYVQSQASVSGADCDKHRDDEKQNSEISEVCSLTTRQSRKKGSSLSRLWKSSRASNAEDFKISFELTNGRLCNGSSFNATLSPARKSAETGLSSVCNWSSPELLNLHITNGLKGRVEWSQPTKKQSLKAKLMEARIQSQKVQLRQVLKQKI